LEEHFQENLIVADKADCRIAMQLVMHCGAGQSTGIICSFDRKLPPITHLRDWWSHGICYADRFAMQQGACMHKSVQKKRGLARQDAVPVPFFSERSKKNVKRDN
jgi:hypothetical protein